MKEHDFITQINIIAENNNCRTILIDPTNRLINIEGTKENELTCALQISEFMSTVDEITEMTYQGHQLTKDIAWML